MRWLQPFQKLGKHTLNFFAEFGAVHLLIGRMAVNLRSLTKDWDLLVSQMMQIGVQSLPLVTIVSIFAGAVSAWQAAYQFGGIVPMSYLGPATGTVMILEMGPVLTGLVIAGRNGASIAAEIGSMRVTEQIDALESMAIDPVRYLAVPRVLAATIMLPVLVIFADFIGMIGAFAVANLAYDQSVSVFFGSYREYFAVTDLVVSLSKGLVFGFTTALVGVHVGLQTEGGAKGVGASAIKAFVFSAAVILINDFLVTTIIL